MLQYTDHTPTDRNHPLFQYFLYSENNAAKA